MVRRSSRPVFGELGRDSLKKIEYLGKLPVVFGPFMTGKKYIFRQGKNPRLVDPRDLTDLTKAAGRGKLRDVDAPEKPPKPQKAKHPAEPETKPAEKPAEEVVDDATD